MGSMGKTSVRSSFSIRPRVLALVLVQKPSEGLGYAFEIPNNRPGAVEIAFEIPIGVEKEVSGTDLAVSHSFVLKPDSGTAQLLHPARSGLLGEYCGDMRNLFVAGRRASR